MNRDLIGKDRFEIDFSKEVHCYQIINERAKNKIDEFEVDS